MKRCDKCGHRLTQEAWIWGRMENANGREFKVRHLGPTSQCGGYFVPLVTRIGGKA
jgi:hypothetical protein